MKTLCLGNIMVHSVPWNGYLNILGFSWISMNIWPTFHLRFIFRKSVSNLILCIPHRSRQWCVFLHGHGGVMWVQLKTGGEKFTNQLGTDSYCPNICFCLVGGKSCCKKCCGLFNASITIPTLRVFLNMFFLNLRMPLLNGGWRQKLWRSLLSQIAWEHHCWEALDIPRTFWFCDVRVIRHLYWGFSSQHYIGLGVGWGQAGTLAQIEFWRVSERSAEVPIGCELAVGNAWMMGFQQIITPAKKYLKEYLCMFWKFVDFFLRKFAVKIWESRCPCWEHRTGTKYCACQWNLILRLFHISAKPSKMGPVF